MRISDSVYDLVRKRAGFACEYCGVTESDAEATSRLTTIGQRTTAAMTIPQISSMLASGAISIRPVIGHESRLRSASGIHERNLFPPIYLSWTMAVCLH